MTDEAVLLRDPVFQLNTLLWSLNELPHSGHIHPILRAAGYYLNAIGRRVVIPADPSVREKLAILTEKDLSPSRPDLWLKHQTDPVDPIIELKARGFSPKSSNAFQALKLVASASDLATSVGGGGIQLGHVIYLTVGEDAAGMSETLTELRSSLVLMSVPAAPTGAIGLASVDDGIALMSPAPGELPGPAQAALQEPALVLERSDAEDDLAPLYFIPWLPGIEKSQNSDLHADGLRELTARLLTQAIAAVGQARPPVSVTVTGTELLDNATFGIFARWRDADRQKFSQAATKIIDRALRATGHARGDNDRVEIDLPSEEAQAQVLERLEQADPADPSKNLQGVMQEHPTLFDELPAARDTDAQAVRFEAGPDDEAR